MSKRIKAYKWSKVGDRTEITVAEMINPAFKPVRKYSFNRDIPAKAAKQRRKERPKYF